MEVTLEQLVVTALTAFLGAWVAAYLALGRFREERAFDRRMEWYDRALRLTREAFAVTGAAQWDVLHGRQHENELTERSQAAVSALMGEIVLSHLYGSEKLTQELRAHTRALRAQQIAFNATPAGNPAPVAKAFDPILLELLEMEQTIARHGRRHLSGVLLGPIREWRRRRRELQELRTKQRA